MTTSPVGRVTRSGASQDREGNDGGRKFSNPTASVSGVEDDGGESATPSIIQEVANTDYLQRKVHCSLCLKRFWSLQDLRRHMRSHTGKYDLIL